MPIYSILSKILLPGTLMAAIFCLVPPVEGAARKIELAPLEASDCRKCHRFQFAIMVRNGGKHRTAVTCIECHPQHPPRGVNTIPKCSQCHSGTPHFQLDDCLGCHTNPHMPIASIIFPPKPARKACLSCHEQAAQAFEESPSKHGNQSCTFCHTEHGEIPDCLRCHAPHAAGQDTANCFQCHSGHRPLEIVPSGMIPLKFCRPCHQQESRDLSRTSTFHGTLPCIYCHQGSHPNSPECRDCHGLPHGAVMHGKNPDCLHCHQDPHFLIS